MKSKQAFSDLLDDGYYNSFTVKIDIDGISTVPAEIIVPLKARAWLDLIGRRDAGEKVDSNDIKKHKNDVFRLFQVIEPDKRLSLPEVIKNEYAAFSGGGSDRTASIFETFRAW